MHIDWSKLIEMLMLTTLRKPKALAFIKGCLVNEMKQLKIKYDHLFDIVAFRATMSNSVLDLEKLIEKLTECAVEITELDGKPFDFLVQIDGTVDVKYVENILNSCVAGKSFAFRLGAVSYSCAFKNHVVENKLTTYICQFSNHVAMDDIGRQITISVDVLEGFLSAYSSRVVTSDVTIVCTVYSVVANKAVNRGYKSVTILNGADFGNIELAWLDASYAIINSITPASDTYSDYKNVN